MTKRNELRIRGWYYDQRVSVIAEPRLFSGVRLGAYVLIVFIIAAIVLS